MKEQIESIVTKVIMKYLPAQNDDINLDLPFSSFGIDSIEVVDIMLEVLDLTDKENNYDINFRMISSPRDLINAILVESKKINN